MTGALAFRKAATSSEINQWKRQKFLSLYPNRHRSILKPAGCQNWTTVSKHGYLSDDDILNAVSAESSRIRGARWDDRSRFSVFDIDINSQYHNELGLARFKHVLNSLGVKPSIYQCDLANYFAHFGELFCVF